MGWAVGRAPSSPPFDFYSTIDLRCGLYLLNFELSDYPYSDDGRWVDNVKGAPEFRSKILTSTSKFTER
jgi:hypothetical protein